MSKLSVMDRLLVPQFNSPQRADFLIQPEGDAFLDPAMKLTFSITVDGFRPAVPRISPPENGFTYDLSYRAGGAAVIDSIEVSSANGTQLCRIDDISKYCSFQNLRADNASIVELENTLMSSHTTTGLDADGKSVWYRRAQMPTGFSDDYRTTKRVLVDLRKIIGMLSDLIPLKAMGGLVFRFIWNMDNPFSGEGYDSWAVTNPELAYTLINFRGQAPKIPDSITFFENMLARNTLPATTNGTVQRTSLPLGFSGETLSRLFIAKVCQDRTTYPPANNQLTFIVTADSATGATTLTLNTVLGLAVGDPIADIAPTAGIPARATITAINTGTRVVTISAALTADVDTNDEVSGPTIALESAITVAGDGVSDAGQNILTLAYASNVRAGDKIFSPRCLGAIPEYVTRVVGNEVFLAHNLLFDTVDTQSFYVVPGDDPLHDNRSDLLTGEACNLKIDGALQYPTQLPRGHLLSELEHSYGALAIPASSYGECAADLTANRFIRGTSSYLGFDVGKTLASDLDLEIQRSGTPKTEDVSPVDIYAYGQVLREFKIGGGMVTRVA